MGSNSVIGGGLTGGLGGNGEGGGVSGDSGGKDGTRGRVGSHRSRSRDGIEKTMGSQLLSPFFLPPFLPPPPPPSPGSRSTPMILHPAGRHHKGLGPPAGGSEVSHKGVTAAPCPEVHDYSIGLKSLARAARVRNSDNNNHTTYIFFLSPGGDFVATIDHVLVQDGFRFCGQDLKKSYFIAGHEAHKI